jgi:hypothetical protein
VKVVKTATGQKEVPLVAPEAETMGEDVEELEEQVIELMNEVDVMENQQGAGTSTIKLAALLLKVRGLIAKAGLLLCSNCLTTSI